MPKTEPSELELFKEEILAAVAGSKIELLAELRREFGAIRSELGGIRKGIEMIAIKLLSDSEVDEVRRAVAR